jgi:hypothetical protein
MGFKKITSIIRCGLDRFDAEAFIEPVGYITFWFTTKKEADAGRNEFDIFGAGRSHAAGHPGATVAG